MVLHIVVGHGTSHISTNGHSCGGRAAEDHRRVYRTGQFGDANISIAKMTSPSGWSEPGQTPEFDEYTIVLRGELRVETTEAVHQVGAGQAIIVSWGSGCVTVRPVRRVRNTLPYACPLSRREPCTETQSDGDENCQMQFSN